MKDASTNVGMRHMHGMFLKANLDYVRRHSPDVRKECVGDAERGLSLACYPISEDRFLVTAQVFFRRLDTIVEMQYDSGRAVGEYSFLDDLVAYVKTQDGEVQYLYGLAESVMRSGKE